MNYYFFKNRIYITLLKKTRIKLYVVKVLSEKHKTFLINYLKNKTTCNKKDLYYKFKKNEFI